MIFNLYLDFIYIESIKILTMSELASKIRWLVIVVEFMV
jgi:hypothetical protein